MGRKAIEIEARCALSHRYKTTNKDMDKPCPICEGLKNETKATRTDKGISDINTVGGTPNTGGAVIGDTDCGKRH